MPSLGYGFQGVGGLTRYIDGCADCDSQDVHVDYQGGHYARVMLGMYFSKHKPILSRYGSTMSYQRFLAPDGAHLTDQFVFWASAGLGNAR